VGASDRWCRTRRDAVQAAEVRPCHGRACDPGKDDLDPLLISALHFTADTRSATTMEPAGEIRVHARRRHGQL
jgi:hypothetical protein